MQLELPDDVVLEQLKYLPIDDVLNACNVNQQFTRVCANPYFWKQKLDRDFPEAKLARGQDYRQLYMDLIQAQATQKLAEILNSGFFVDLDSPPLENITVYDDDDEDVPLGPEFTTPINGLHKVAIIYSLDGYEHPVTYGTNKSISPMDVLQSIYEFGQHPFTQANADAIFGPGEVNITPEIKMKDVLTTLDHRYLEGVTYTPEGFLLSFT